MSAWEAQVARVDTEHGDRWVAWRDGGVVAVGRTRAEAARRARAAGAGRVVAGDPGRVPAQPDWTLLPGGFRGRALRACHGLAFGEVITYAELARRAGSPRAARAAGSAMAANPLPVVIPCHRVVRSDGGLGGYSAGGTAAKRRMLRTEGVLPPRG
ncbi:MAG: methylated-DNA--[protein]-cysteine S-methyltransferase [Actinobacteria bacterium]|nr:methylated-DNA--[protein]-cysteine S-methyltransferase [Actinomycetota bacterium]MBM3697238.1 methylated-DNA--[protein]-cysteine S-methyltransferase [Actinomycetota bacterium]